MGCVELRCSMLKYIGQPGYQSLKIKIKIRHSILIKYRLCTCCSSLCYCHLAYLVPFRSIWASNYLDIYYLCLTLTSRNIWCLFEAVRLSAPLPFYPNDRIHIWATFRIPQVALLSALTWTAFRPTNAANVWLNVWSVWTTVRERFCWTAEAALAIANKDGDAHMVFFITQKYLSPRGWAIRGVFEDIADTRPFAKRSSFS